MPAVPQSFSARTRVTSMSNGQVADAARNNWVDRFAPLAMRPHLRLMRVDRPIGYWLLFWPCAWSLALASLSHVDGWLNLWFLRMLGLFFIGAVVMRGAGCVWNDITDRHIDAAVARTRSRPIPSGQVSLGAAVAFMGLLLLAGLLVLLQLNQFSIWLGISSLVIVAIYPFMKRFTHWPQAVLGLAFGWGALMGWSARLATVDVVSLLLYAGTIFWIIGYDTIYAHQDREDDALIGMKSTALQFGAATKWWLQLFYGLTTLLILAALLLAGLGDDVGVGGYATSALAIMLFGLGCTTGLLLWQIRTLDIDNAETCLQLFRFNHVYGASLFTTIVLVWLAQSVAIGRTYWTPWF